jgi:hypothetical protein
VKPKHSSVFKRHEDDNDEDDDEDEDLIQHLSRFQQELQNVPVTWGSEPQSPWSQPEEYLEQNRVIVPSITEPVLVPNLYTPQGVGLYYFNFVTYIIFI